MALITSASARADWRQSAGVHPDTARAVSAIRLRAANRMYRAGVRVGTGIERTGGRAANQAESALMNARWHFNGSDLELHPSEATRTRDRMDGIGIRAAESMRSQGQREAMRIRRAGVQAAREILDAPNRNGVADRTYRVRAARDVRETSQRMAEHVERRSARAAYGTTVRLRRMGDRVASNAAHTGSSRADVRARARARTYEAVHSIGADVAQFSRSSGERIETNVINNAGAIHEMAGPTNH
jgi:hypothetical protein